MAIQPVPTLVLASPFPTNADRVAGIFNAMSKAWADSENPMALSVREIAVVTYNNANEAFNFATAASASAASAEGFKNQAQGYANSAGSSAAVVGRWDKLVLGPKSTPPTVDNDGQPLLEGAEYYNTVTKARYSWTGTAWMIGTNVTAGVSSINGKTGVVNLGIADVVAPGDIVAFGATEAEARAKIKATDGSIKRIARTANTMLDASALASLVDVMSGTFTQTFATAATLASGWWCYLRNSGSGVVTLQAPAGATIDGLASYIMYPGECRLVQCDGSVFRTLIIAPMRLTMRTSFDFAKPPGYRAFDIDVRGATGGGGGGGSGCRVTSTASAAYGGGGGGSGGVGGRWWARFRAEVVGATTSFAVGAKGLGGAGATTPTGAAANGVAGTAGTAGGTTSVLIDTTTAFTVPGGTGGAQGAAATTGAVGAGGAAGTSVSPTSGGNPGGSAAARHNWLSHLLVGGAAGSAGSTSAGGSAAQAPGGDKGASASNSLGAGASGAGGNGGPGVKNGTDPSVSQAGADGEDAMVIIEGVV